MKFNLSEMLVFSYFSSRMETSIPVLAKHLNVQSSTIVGIVSKLEHGGLISKVSTLAGKRGRPRFLYRLKIPQPIIACIFEVGQLTGAVLDTHLKIRAKEVLHFERIENLNHAFKLMKQLVDRLKKNPNTGSLNVQGLSLSISAIHSRGRIVSSVLPWDPALLAESLSASLNMPVEFIFSPNLLAVYQKLPTPVPESFVFLHVGDGMSAHSVIRGSIYRGVSNMAGAIGHFSVDPNGPLCGCGQRGCLETYCSGPSIFHRVIEGLDSGVVSHLKLPDLEACSPRDALEHIWTAWREGDTFIRTLMDGTFDRIGWALGITLNVLDPEVVTIGGYVFSNKEEWFDEVIRRARKWVLEAATRKTKYVMSTVKVEDVLRVAGTSYFYERAMHNRVSLAFRN